VRARAGHRSTERRTGRQRVGADELVDRHRPGQLEVAAHTGRRGLVVVVQRGGQRVALGRGPTPVEHTGPTAGSQLVEPVGPLRDGAAEHQGEQQIVQLIGITRSGADLLEHTGHRFGIKRVQFIDRHREAVGPERAQAAPQCDGTGAPLLQRGAVEEGEGSSAQDAVGER
jgi:hypothetical protein